MTNEIKTVLIVVLVAAGGYYLYKRYTDNKAMEKLKADELAKTQTPATTGTTPSQPLSATIVNQTDGNIPATTAQVFAAPSVVSGQNAV